jgi:polysaccharide export outer membrane protein
MAAPETDTAYRLGGGDKIAINVFGENNISGTYQVDASGAVALPLVGRVEAGDLTPAEFEKELVDKLKDDIVQDPRVSVSVLEYRPFYIVGEVAKPGAYSFFNGFTILNALALAGGQTYRADLSRISIIRRTKTGDTKLSGGSLASIQPGDVIVVPERNF